MNKNLKASIIFAILIIGVDYCQAQKPIEANAVKNFAEIENYGGVLITKANEKEVLNGSLDSKFSPFRAADLDKDDSEFWIRFSIINNTGVNQKYYMGTSKFDSITFYMPDTDDKYSQQRSGRLYPNALKKLKYGHFSFADIKVFSNDTAVCYIHVINTKIPFFQFVPLQLTLHTEPYFHTAYANTRTFNLIFLGIVAIMAFYNLTLLFITREKAYLFYVGYNLSILSYVFALSGDATALFFPSASFQENLVLFTGIASLCFYILFAKSILELKLFFGKWNKILSYIVFIATLALIPTAANWVNVSIPVCFMLALIAYPAILGLSISLVIRKNIPATYFLVANSFYITFLMISILQMLGVLPTFIFGMQANVFVQMGVSIELALFSLGLGARIISIREKTLKESEERLSQFLEAMPVGVFVIDKNGNPYYSNNAANLLLRKELKTDLPVKSLSEFYKSYKAGTNEVYPADQMPVVKALQGESTFAEDLEIRHPDRLISLEVSARPIYDENKKIISAIAVFQDITQRLNAKKQLEEYNQTLELKVQERTHEILQQKDEIEKEKLKSDTLLLNILPEEIAQELKEYGKSDARLFNEVTVMFTDFVNFTSISETLTPEELVHELDYCFQKFDDIITTHNLEKIKTIGDAYLSVCGLPIPQEMHAQLVIKAAVEILHFMKQYEAERRKINLPYFEVRIGIHSGPVVAGIVGIKKFAYDIWGDTVNTASRMESSSEPGQINISGATYEIVKNEIACLHRGKITAKNKGMIDMYFVNLEAYSN
jgi:class 3 adenylate cyclase/PAS domain-containing protein